MNVELKIAGLDLVEIIPTWATNPDLAEYFRNWPPMQDWNRPDLIASKLDGAYGVYEDSKLVGMVHFYQANPAGRAIEYGGLIDASRCSNRKEVSDKLHLLVLDYVFNYLNYNRVAIRILDHREKLIKRYVDFGYQIEGILRESTRYNGEFRNEVLLSYLNLKGVK